MGLDITAYKNIEKVEVTHMEDGHPDEKSEYDFHALLNPDFPDQAGSIEHNACYLAEEEFGFRAGSYGGYNRWREELAELAGYPKTGYDHSFFGYGERHFYGACETDQGPFWELIYFSDCEGVIGTEVSKKLHQDFLHYVDKAEEIGEMFYCKYLEWMKAFELASQNGAVDFH